MSMNEGGTAQSIEAGISFAELGLTASTVERVVSVGFTTPTPVQARVIPILLDGQDVLALAQTGTGKTAAFVLPLLEKIDRLAKVPQLLVLAPTRELAQQVAAVFVQFGKGVRVSAVYGGQGMRQQLTDLAKGVHVVVGTPGRVMDHVRRGTLKLDNIGMVVLDEADEMLNMGFSEDIEWILGHTPEEKLVALFSATMPNAIRKIAHNYLRKHVEVKIAAKQSDVPTIDQRYWIATDINRLDAISRILEVDEPQAVLIFVRTKSATIEVADALAARGFNAAAINGDLPQQAREALISKLKRGTLQVLVATDVAARGLDVDRIELVVNYELPTNAETYVHRIGRTGRAGRSGRAILFLSPRERRFLKNIQQLGKGDVKELTLPTKIQVQGARVRRFKNEIQSFLAEGRPTEGLEKIIDEVAVECGVTASTVAAALCVRAKLLPAFETKEGGNKEAFEGEENSRKSKRSRDGGDVERPARDFQREGRNKREGSRDGGKRDFKKDFASDFKKKDFSKEKRSRTISDFEFAQPRSERIKSRDEGGDFRKPAKREFGVEGTTASDRGERKPYKGAGKTSGKPRYDDRKSSDSEGARKKKSFDEFRGPGGKFSKDSKGPRKESGSGKGGAAARGARSDKVGSGSKKK
jgi:ATP-dependent RNA helicase DeaD